QRGAAGPQPPGPITRPETPSRSAVLCQPLRGGEACGAGAVSSRNCSSAAAIAAASSSVAVGATAISIFGLGGLCLPVRPGMTQMYFAVRVPSPSSPVPGTGGVISARTVGFSWATRRRGEEMSVSRYVRQHHLGLVAIFIALTGTAYAGNQAASSRQQTAKA